MHVAQPLTDVHKQGHEDQRMRPHATHVLLHRHPENRHIQRHRADSEGSGEWGVIPYGAQGVLLG